MNVDVVVTWPRHCDYPLWRGALLEQRARFARVLVAFTDHHCRYDYRAHVAAQLGPSVVGFDAPGGEGDWRDLAVNACLELSTAEWVWFTEQDLLILDPDRFWGVVARHAGDGEALGWREPGSDRWHPSCLLVRREAAERTRRYFGPRPVDHFWTFGRELEGVFDLGRVLGFGGILDADVDVVHLAGLSHNHWLLDCGRPVTFKPDEFRTYLQSTLAVGGGLEPGWAARVSRYLDRDNR